MIQHVVERVRRADQVSRVVVATDDETIKAAVAAFGAVTVRFVGCAVIAGG